MTNREFFTAVIESAISDEMTSFATKALEKLDATNEKRRNTPSKKTLENAPIIAAIKEVLTNEVQTASEIAAKVEISVQKASSLLRQIVAEGFATSTDIKVKGKGAQKGYKLAETEDETEEVVEG